MYGAELRQYAGSDMAHADVYSQRKLHYAHRWEFLFTRIQPRCRSSCTEPLTFPYNAQTARADNLLVA
jgi:hypothetical protein